MKWKLFPFYPSKEVFLSLLPFKQFFVHPKKTFECKSIPLPTNQHLSCSFWRQGVIGWQNPESYCWWKNSKKPLGMYKRLYNGINYLWTWLGNPVYVHLRKTRRIRIQCLPLLSRRHACSLTLLRTSSASKHPRPHFWTRKRTTKKTQANMMGGEDGGWGGWGVGVVFFLWLVGWWLGWLRNLLSFHFNHLGASNKQFKLAIVS